MATAHYKAFISYSHQDESWAQWLQKSLESYRVPRRLVGTTGAHGPIPSRLHPVFRDREDLSSASDLTERIKQELAASETLIVICSPAAARSRWVEEEIRYFRELGRGDRILALIVEGDPQAAGGQPSCFPDELVRNADGSVHEPLAADARKYADGRALARLKLVAGILGIRLDELRRRDAQRRTRRRLSWGMATLATFGVIGWLAWTALSTQETVRVQRANTEELLSFMLGDLKRLDPIEGLEIVDQGDPLLRKYHATLGFDTMPAESLMEAALDWRERGTSHFYRGALEPAMEEFQRSRAALVELHRREGSSRSALFELGQAEFWVGYVHLDRGELDEAQNSFARYGAITRRLINMEPKNPVYVMELAYSLANLGAIERARRNPDTSRMLQYLQSAVQYNQMALVLDPDNDVYRRDLATTLAHLSDAWLDQCDLGNAFALRTQNVELTRELHLRAPDNPRRQEELAFALSGLAAVQQQMGLTGLAAENLAESGKLLAELHAAEPDNRSLEWQALLRTQRLARLALGAGRYDEAWELAQPMLETVDAFLAASAGSDLVAAVEAEQFRVDYARIALKRGLESDGRRELARAVRELAARVREHPGHRESLQQLAFAGVEFWRHTGQLPGDGVNELLDDYLDDDARDRSCSEAGLAARLALMRGDRERAAGYTRYVLAKGYFEPDFVSFCREFALCDLEPGARPATVAAVDDDIDIDRAASNQAEQ